MTKSRTKAFTFLISFLILPILLAFTACGEDSKTELKDSMLEDFLDGKTFVYDGNQKTFDMEEINGVLVQKIGEIAGLDQEYEILYENNINVGTARVIVSAKPNAKHIVGTARGNFTITKATVNTVGTINENQFGYGDPLEFTITPAATTLGAETVTYTYSETEDGEFAPLPNPNNLAKGTYYVKATIAETDNYAGATETQAFEIVSKQVVMPTIAGGDTQVYTGLLRTFYIDGAREGITNFARVNPTESWGAARDEYGRITVTATNAGIYRVNVSLADEVNYVWKDAEQGEETATLTFEFEITKAENSISSLGPTVYEFSDDPTFEVTARDAANTATFKYADYVDEERPEDDQFVDERPTRIGTYWIMATIAEGDNFTAAKYYTTFRIEPKQVTKPTSPAETTVTYDGTEKTFVVTGFDSTRMQADVTAGASIEIVGNTVVVKATNVANNQDKTYVISISLIQPNEDTSYVWRHGAAEPATSDPIEIEINISQAINTWATQPAIEGWSYGEEPNDPAGAATFGEVAFVYKNEAGEVIELSDNMEPGNYTMEASVEEALNWSALNETVNFVVAKLDTEITNVTPLTFEYGDDIEFVVTASHEGAQSFYFASVVGDDVINPPTEGWTLTEPTETGSYWVKVIVAGDNHYNDGIAYRVFTITKTIATVMVEPTKAEFVYGDDTIGPDAFDVETTSTGAQTFEYYTRSGESPDYIYTKLDAAPTTVGTYYVVVKVAENDDFEACQSGYVQFVITAKAIAKVVNLSESTTVEYDAAGYTFSVNGYNSSVMTMQATELAEGKTTVDDAIVSIAAKDVGTYGLTFTLNDTTNYVWEDAEAGQETTPLTFTYTINKKVVAQPALASGCSLNNTYTGEEFTFTVNGFNADLMSATAGTVDGNSVYTTGTTVTLSPYTITIALLYPENYTWAVEPSEDPTSDPISFEFVIAKATNSWTTAPSITGWTYGEEASVPVEGTAAFGTANVTYEVFIPAVAPATEGIWADIGSFENVEDAGNYRMVVSAIAETNNYTGLESVVIPFTVAKAAPEISTTYEFPETWTSEADNASFVLPTADDFETTFGEVVVRYFNEDEEEVSATIAKKYVGTYTMVAAVYESNNWNQAIFDKTFTITQAKTNEVVIDEYHSQFVYPYRIPPLHIVWEATHYYGNFEVYYKESGEGEWSLIEGPMPFDVGTYDIKIVVVATDDYVGAYATTQVEVQAGNLSSFNYTIASANKSGSITFADDEFTTTGISNVSQEFDIEGALKLSVFIGNADTTANTVTFTNFASSYIDYMYASRGFDTQTSEFVYSDKITPAEGVITLDVVDCKAYIYIAGLDYSIEFNLTQAYNTWAAEGEPSITESWTYGQEPATPTATPTYGEVTFTYYQYKEGYETYMVEVQTLVREINEAQEDYADIYAPLQAIENQINALWAQYAVAADEAKAGIMEQIEAAQSDYNDLYATLEEQLTEASAELMGLITEANAYMAEHFNDIFEPMDPPTAETPVGEYFVKVTVAAGDFYTALDDMIGFEITPIEINTKLVADTLETTYSGSAKTLEVTGFDVETMVASDLSAGATFVGGVLSATNAGTYTVTIAPKANYVWSDETTDAITFTIEIAKAALVKPEAIGDLVFTDTQQNGVSGFDANTMDYTGTISAVEAGDYSATISIKYANNYEWADHTQTSVVINWSIRKANNYVYSNAMEYGVIAPPTFTVDFGDASAVEIEQYGIDDVTWVDTFMEFMIATDKGNVGNYYVKVSVLGTTNYYEINSEAIPLDIIASTVFNVSFNVGPEELKTIGMKLQNDPVTGRDQFSKNTEFSQDFTFDVAMTSTTTDLVVYIGSDAQSAISDDHITFTNFASSFKNFMYSDASYTTPIDVTEEGTVVLDLASDDCAYVYLKVPMGGTDYEYVTVQFVMLTQATVTTFEELNVALANEDVDLITLGENISDATQISFNRDVTIDLNGKTLAFAGTCGNLITNAANKNVTIKNGKIDYVSTTTSSSSVSYILNNGNLILKGVDYTASGLGQGNSSNQPVSAIINNGNGVLNIVDSTITATYTGTTKYKPLGVFNLGRTLNFTNSTLTVDACATGSTYGIYDYINKGDYNAGNRTSTITNSTINVTTTQAVTLDPIFAESYIADENVAIINIEEGTVLNATRNMTSASDAKTYGLRAKGNAIVYGAGNAFININDSTGCAKLYYAEELNDDDSSGSTSFGTTGRIDGLTTVTTKAGLVEALAGEYSVIILGEDINLGSTELTINRDVVICGTNGTSKHKIFVTDRSTEAPTSKMITVTGGTLTLQSVDIQAAEPQRVRAIEVTEQANLVVVNSTITARYAIFLRNAEINLALINSTVNSWGVVQSQSSGSIVVDNCTLTGTNNFDGTDNDYAIISIFGSGSDTTISNSTLNVVANGTAPQYAVNIKPVAALSAEGSNNTVVLENTTINLTGANASNFNDEGTNNSSYTVNTITTIIVKEDTSRTFTIAELNAITNLNGIVLGAGATATVDGACYNLFTTASGTISETYDDSTGKYTYSVVAGTNATINVASEDALRAAVLNTDVDTINLTNDLTITSHVAIRRSLTFDLNNNTITNTSTTLPVLAVIGAGVNTTIQNGELIGADGIQSNGNATTTVVNVTITATNVGLYASNTGHLVVTSANVTAVSSAVYITGKTVAGDYGGSTAVINGGTFTSTANPVVSTNGTTGQGGSQITINGGTFYASMTTAGELACGVYVANSDTVTINGGTFNVTDGVGVLARSGNTTIGADVTFNVAASTVEGTICSGANIVEAGQVIVIDKFANYPGGVPTVTNNSTYTVNTIKTIVVADDASRTFAIADLNAAADLEGIVLGAGSTVTVDGACYNLFTTASGTISETYDDSTGKYTYSVVAGTNATINVASEDALRAAALNEDVDTINLTNNLTITSHVAIRRSLTFDLNNNTITNTSTALPVLAVIGADVNTTIQNGTLVGKDGIQSNGNATTTVVNVTITATNVGLYASNTGHLVVTSANVTAVSSAVYITGKTVAGDYGGSTAVINGGTFTSTANPVVSTNGTTGQGGSQITINGGIFNASMTTAGELACGVYVANSDTVTINGGTFNVTDGVGVLARSGNTTIGADVTITATGSSQGVVCDGATIITAGYEIVVDEVANYSGGLPTVTNNSSYTVNTITNQP